ncbi:MAG: hypothetical protein QOJ29_2695 [Thermoleophilaceae bacterium]|jgi:hypothetical protein|nr:hypothetical protein [Thermoleophilaceae bacterium]
MPREHLPLRDDSSAAIPCLYCFGTVAADGFTYWSASRRLMSADYPSCARRVTLTAATWRRWAIPAAAAIS